jgi:imidazolonepropionase-like amidohydrolase
MRVFFLLFLLASAFLSRAQTSGSVLLLNGNVIDVETGLISHRTILIEGDKIKAVGDYQQLVTQASKNARRVDCSGKYIIPGLWDMHVHL